MKGCADSKIVTFQVLAQLTYSTKVINVYKIVEIKLRTIS